MTTFRGPIDRATACFSDRPALVDGLSGEVTTFADLGRHTRAVAVHLDRLGVPPGGRVAFLADGSVPYAEWYLGVPAAGRIFVPLNTRYTETELRAACNDCTPDILLTDREQGLPGGLAPSVIAVTDIDLGMVPDRQAACVEVGENDPAAIFYTGGTTDRAKGVSLSHRNKLADALSFIIGFELQAEDRWLVMSPMFHAAGSFNVVPCTWVGAAQVFLPRFDAEMALRAIETHRTTATFAVPTMLAALCDAQERLGADTSSMRLLGHGGAPITAALLDRVARTFPGTEICGSYGATEMAPLATIHRHQERVLGMDRSRSVGLPVVGVEVRAEDVSGHSAAPGELGELVVTGPNIMLGYWGKSEATAQVLRDASYRSGDIGYCDAEGYVYVVDRSKDMIITGGENVYGVEVEDVLCSHPSVAEAGVIGRPDPRWGEVVVAVIVARTAVDAGELDRHCRALLAGYKVPRTYVIREEPLPRSAAGKLLKRELRQSMSAEPDARP